MHDQGREIDREVKKHLHTGHSIDDRSIEQMQAAIIHHLDVTAAVMGTSTSFDLEIRKLVPHGDGDGTETLIIDSIERELMFSSIIDAMVMASNSSDDRVGIQAVYEFCLDMIEQRDFIAIGRFMDAINVEKLSIVIMLAPLSITVPCKRPIPERARYYDRVEAALRCSNDVDYVDSLLRGLK